MRVDLSRPSTSGSLLYVMVISLVAAIGGLLFGFDTAVISGAQDFFIKEFALSKFMAGWVVSSVLVGCMLGAMIAGPLSDRFGRKKILLLSAVLFTVSSIFCGLAASMMHLVCARLLGGLGIGIASMVSPLYIAEVAPPAVRGRLVAMQQLAIVSGILVAFFSNRLFLGANLSDPAKWRWMLAVAAFPSVLFFFFLIPVPESPRWLVKQGFRDRAGEILARVAGSEQAAVEMQQIELAITQEQGSFSELLQPGLRRALLIGIALAVLQQFSGINTIMYYAPVIFKASGAAATLAYDNTIYVGLVNLLFTLLSMVLVDRVGRKPLLVGGAAGMTLSLGLVSYSFFKAITGLWVLAAILSYVACFAVSTGVVVWVIISEIFPTRVRGRAMSVATVFLWSACYLVSQTFLDLLEKYGPARTFLGYALICLITIFFAWIFVPETKGRSLEEIERSWR